MGEKYVIDKATLDDIGDAIREKSGSTGSMTGSAMAGRIRAIELGVKLPALTNPADAAQVLKGYEFINPETGEAAEGTLVPGVKMATGTVTNGISKEHTLTYGSEIVALLASSYRGTNTTDLYHGGIFTPNVKVRLSKGGGYSNDSGTNIRIWYSGNTVTIATSNSDNALPVNYIVFYKE